MKLPSLVMTSGTHKEAFRYLFPGDGLEAAGILLCNQGTGRHYQKLIATEFVGLPYELSKREADHVTWPFEAHFTPENIADVDRRGQSILTIHSHPNSQNQFSWIDDDNDRELFGSINGWFDDGRLNGAAIMMPDGSIIARTVSYTGAFQHFRAVSVVGDTIQFWTDTKDVASTAYGEKQSQTLGKGTLDKLQSMKVGVVGCSGTGSIIIELLTRNCVGELVIIDDDVLEEKNLNRIVNGMMKDAKQRLSKVVATKKAIKRIGLQTNVEVHEALTDSPKAVAALIDCDVFFGCVDSAFGRYHLDCLSSAYLVPYFDVGVHIEADGAGNISAADAVAHYVHPDGSDLLSRGSYQMDQVTAEIWQRTDPQYYAEQRIAGYLAEVGEEQPAVMSVNMQAACMAFNDFISRVHAFRLDKDQEFATQRFRLVHGNYECEADHGRPHKLFARYKGSGDHSLLVRNNIRRD